MTDISQVLSQEMENCRQFVNLNSNLWKVGKSLNGFTFLYGKAVAEKKSVLH